MKKLKFSRAKNTLCGKILRRILGEECGAVAMEYIVIARTDHRRYAVHKQFSN